MISAARDLVATSSSSVGFSIDGVAKAADVARMTVYYQFGSKTGSWKRRLTTSRRNREEGAHQGIHVLLGRITATTAPPRATSSVSRRCCSP
ncbi:MAG TPA: TetR/AcrR family transcriptional regulator [Chloroflexota bacterium]|nr:TetR/AcrR family transcriptional regulator [Chloroflexota bacterium]